MELTSEEKANLAEFLDREEYKLLLKVINALLAKEEGKVVKYSLGGLHGERGLIWEKCRAEGADRYSGALVRELNKIRNRVVT